MSTALMSYMASLGFTDSLLGGNCKGKELILGNRQFVVTDSEGFGYPDNVAEGWRVRVFAWPNHDYDACLIEELESDSYPQSGPCLALCKAIHRHGPPLSLAEKAIAQATAKMADNGGAAC